MIVIFVAALIAAYIGYALEYSIQHGYNDAAVLIVVAVVVGLLLWCEIAWSMMA